MTDPTTKHPLHTEAENTKAHPPSVIAEKKAKEAGTDADADKLAKKDAEPKVAAAASAEERAYAEANPDLGPPTWFVPFPLSQYKENVPALAKARGFKVEDAKNAPKVGSAEALKVDRAVNAPVISIKTDLNKEAYPDDAPNVKAIRAVHARVAEDEKRAAEGAKAERQFNKDAKAQAEASGSHQLTGPERVKAQEEKAKKAADEPAPVEKKEKTPA